MKNGGENYNLNNNKYKNDYELLHKINNKIRKINYQIIIAQRQMMITRQLFIYIVTL